MEGKNIRVYMKFNLKGRFLEAWKKSDTSSITLPRLDKVTLPRIEVIASETKPIFLGANQRSHLREFNSQRLIRADYKMYIGEDVLEKTERYRGVELPKEVLYAPEIFQEQVIRRIYNIVTRTNGYSR